MDGEEGSFGMLLKTLSDVSEEVHARTSLRDFVF